MITQFSHISGYTINYEAFESAQKIFVWQTQREQVQNITQVQSALNPRSLSSVCKKEAVTYHHCIC